VVSAHNNAPSHTLLIVQQFLAERNIPVITQPPSHNLTPIDLAVPNSKNGLQGDIKSNAMAKLCKIAKETSNNGRISGESMCAKGSYFEGD
jgi:hypothetical protein